MRGTRIRPRRVLALLASAAALACAAPAAHAAPLDAAFGGGDGLATLSGLGTSGHQTGQDVLVQPDGKIVVGGIAIGAGGSDSFAIARLNPDGSPDTSFGPDQDGRAVIPMSGGSETLTSVALQPDGRIVAVGEAAGGDSGADVAIVRLDSAGRLDEGFGDGGKALVPIGPGSAGDFAEGVAFQPGGKIVIGASTGELGGSYDVALVRLEPNGRLDDGRGTDPQPADSFQGDGITTAGVGPQDDYIAGMVQQPDGKLVLAVSAEGIHNVGDTDYGAIRFLEDGEVDTGFGTGGRQTIPFDGPSEPWALALQGDGKIVVAGWADTSTASGWGFARLTATGQLDDTGPGAFSGDGKLAFSLAPAAGDEEATDIGVQPDGQIVATGFTQTSEGGYDIAMVRLGGDGSFDASFDGDGKATSAVAPGELADDAYALAVTADAIVAAGSTQPSSQATDIVVARFLQRDLDSDGVDDARDNCPATANRDQRNSDGRGAGDACNADADRDERDDDADNCPSTRNPDQADGDGDGIGDRCDDDHDNDGVTNSRDNCPAQVGPLPSGCPPTGGDDRIFGTTGPDRLCGLLGNDELYGLAGDDTLFGDACEDRTRRVAGAQAADGNDRLIGAEGNDTLYGAGGDDVLSGVSGNDVLFGGDGNDRLNGHTGHDTLRGDAGNDTLSGWKGNDSLSGGRGKDMLSGGDGNDKLTGGPDVNKYTAGAGDDRVNARNGKRETVDCGAGKKDRASVDRRDKVKGCEKVKRARK